MSDDWNVEEELKPLKLTCTSSDCKNGQHCYKPSRKQKAANVVGQCRSCDESAPFDLERIQKLNLEDIDYTIAALRNERIRQYYWTNKIPQKVENYARRIGISKMEAVVEKRIRKSVGSPADEFDGRQTPVENSSKVNAIHFAQHATASCCRQCMEYWYGIPKGRSLTEHEVMYLSNLGMRFIGERFPFLTNEGEKVPPIRNKASKTETKA
ncbi:MAG: DUF4186 family protein [Leptolyngbya sp. UWPOB_LEPTO1]|uniref:DUF4186 family protein n=1 Tax=Leptolyngbya sp. UWPOB_LEPTO1 TaxID=2815653 RepID=UPI001ACD125F|nr:DUF4186 family protein [Leptolyngbya sp. UWPOB_LEPTO1]MBN8564804.1 DUF4186 family protein [Leptolyngbya sp. UWPOB_LEPTO1]